MLLLGALLVCLIGAEIFLRLAGFQVGSPDPEFFAFSDTLGWKGKPNFKGDLIRGQERIHYEMNSWGFRDDPPAPASSSAGKRRLMLLGDSYAMGYEIPKEDRVGELLEKADSSFLAYNFGIMGYSTDQEFLVLKKFGPEVKPDIVLLFFCVNDIYYSEQNTANKHAKPLFRLQNDGSLTLTNVPLPEPSQPSPLLKWTRSHVAVARVVSDAVNRFTEDFERKSDRTLGAGARSKSVAERGGKEDKLLWLSTSDVTDLTYYLLRDLRAESRRLGAQMVVFMCPSNKCWTETRDDDPEGIKLAIQWCNKLEIPCVDLFPVFRRDFLTHQENLYIYDRMHWNERGNRIAAEVALETLRNLMTPMSAPSN